MSPANGGETGGETLILRTRIQLLSSALTCVDRALDDLEGYRRSMSRSTRDGTESLPDRIDQIADEVARLIEPVRRVNLEFYEAVNEQTIALNKLAREAREESQNRTSRLLVLKGTSVEDLGYDVAGIRSRLEKAADLLVGSSNGEGHDEAERVQEAWNKYRECEDESTDVFRAYVDLVRGVLLRDAGLDRELCRVADALIPTWGGFKGYASKSVTIPTSSAGGDISAAQLIRIGFPEWTVWTLPLAAYEFGHVFARKHDAIDDLLSAVPELSPTRTRMLIADAYATAVMGPAYVCAELLLRSALRDEQRVAVMLAMLERIDKAPVSGYRSVRDRMERAWRSALAQDRSPAPAPAAGPLADEPPPEIVDDVRDPAAGGSPNPEDSASGRPDLVQAVVDGVYAKVKVPFGEDEWQRASRLSDQIQSGESTASIAGELGLAHLRQVLAAGWIARIRLYDEQPPSGEAPTEEALWEAVDRLGERVRDISIQVLRSAGENAEATASTGFTTAFGPPLRSRSSPGAASADKDRKGIDRWETP
jgi:hypothetical protein